MNYKSIRPARRLQIAFTLIELLVVLAILAMIAAFAGPQVFKHLASARSDSARIQIENLSAAVDLYKLELATYPPSLSALVEAPAGVGNWNGPYLRKSKIPLDPWGNEFVYQLPGEHGPYDITSLGADKRLGGDGEDADVVSWE